MDYVTAHCVLTGPIVGNHQTHYGPALLAAGVPACLKKELPETIVNVLKKSADTYLEKALNYQAAKVIEE